jgi:hypothetical protein
VTADALEDESSGWFAVSRASLIDAGLSEIDGDRAAQIFGKGAPPDTDPGRTTRDDEKHPKLCPPPYGMAQSAVHSLLVSLNITDIPLGYQPPAGPSVYFGLTYNEREAGQPQTFSYMNFGPKWTTGWVTFITDDNSTATSSPVTHFVSGGGSEGFSGFTAGSGNGGYTGNYAIGLFSQTRLERFVSVINGTNTEWYRMIHRDGSQVVFDVRSGTRVFAGRMIDPHGNEVTLTYGSSPFRLTGIQDCFARSTSILYQNDDTALDPALRNATGSDLRPSRITDPFGRQALFEYVHTSQNGRFRTSACRASPIPWELSPPSPTAQPLPLMPSSR